ncbi:NAD-P-binding protein [Auriscalpium vulgare]|uniref:NAD-P-binding protein n=1 Tax=Auriscalpium vulgare TaxID=40419 RepID=A0ACB8RC59_9AGAM|nr:NAD-P-binding protein [Auriscalpium vulgare]
MDLDLAGVHVLVTGANGGIGLETTRVFLEQGAKVTAHYRSSSASLLPLLAVYGPTALRLESAELSHEDEVINLFGRFRSPSSSDFGRVEIAVVNHGVFKPEDVAVKDMTLTQWEGTFAANLTSSFLVAREYLRALEEGVKESGVINGRFGERAAIVFVGSTAGKYGQHGHADYAAGKSAMMYGLTLSLKNEIVKVASKGRVNSVAPGWVKTPMAHDALKNSSTVYRALATTPLRKVAEASDVANQIVVLASAKVSGHVSGQVVMVEGGMEGRVLNTPAELGLEQSACFS